MFLWQPANTYIISVEFYMIHFKATNGQKWHKDNTLGHMDSYGHIMEYWIDRDNQQLLKQFNYLNKNDIGHLIFLDTIYHPTFKSH